MNNLTVGGYDAERGAPFAYYETLGGGAGAGPAGDGLSAVHVHMTNTLNTPIEALEYAYPFRVRRYALRRGSGGRGQHCGGQGLIRDIEFLVPCPYGLRGGEPGKPGRNLLIREGRGQELPGKAEVRVQAGDILSLRTPGGGGWGSAERGFSSPRARGRQSWPLCQRGGGGGTGRSRSRRLRRRVAQCRNPLCHSAGRA